MFVFLNIFNASDVPELLGGLFLPKIVLCVFIGFILGFVTGRIQVHTSIIIPIYLANYAVSSVHPCVFVSLELP